MIFWSATITVIAGLAHVSDRRSWESDLSLISHIDIPCPCQVWKVGYTVQESHDSALRFCWDVRVAQNRRVAWWTTKPSLEWSFENYIGCSMGVVTSGNNLHPSEQNGPCCLVRNSLLDFGMVGFTIISYRASDRTRIAN